MHNVHQSFKCPRNFNNLGVVFKQLSDLDLFNSIEQFLIILPKPENFTLVLEFMKKRSNNIDVLTVEYIQRQYTVFFEFAKSFGLPTFFVSHESKEGIEQSLQSMYNNVVYLFSSSIFMSEPISKPYPSDTAYDLTLSHDILALPKEKVKLVFNEIIVIPVNYAGLLCARSSLNLLGCLRIGLIDTTYNGRLTAVFIADDQEVRLKQGQRVAQLVIFPTASLSENNFLPEKK